MKMFLYLCGSCDHRFRFDWKNSKPFCPLCGQKEASMVAEYIKRK